jgi:hypothetical protein
MGSGRSKINVGEMNSTLACWIACEDGEVKVN